MVPSRWTEVNDREFIHSIVIASKRGRSFVPLVGSGMSVASGILTGQQFTEYLSYVVVRILGLLPSKLPNESGDLAEQHWDVKNDGWPPMPSQPLIFQTKEIVAKIYEDLRNELRHFDTYTQQLAQPILPAILCDKPEKNDIQRVHKDTLRLLGKYAEMLELSTKKSFSPTALERVKEYAIRSLHDWRATLHFISRLEISSVTAGKKPIGYQSLSIGAPDPSVIDSFNAHIVSGRRPAFGHTLLAHLAEPLRFRTLLTTNFDELIEEAFSAMHKPLRVLAVTSGGGLPDSRLLEARDSLVKLHGGSLNTRGDLTLDEVPSPAECAAFSNIFRASDLLVLGYSASDERVVRLLKAALQRNQTLRIFWVCHTKADAETIEDIFSEDAYTGRLFYCLTSRADLLLYELYQELTLCVPGGGVAHNYAHRVPPKLSSSSAGSADPIGTLGAALKKFRDRQDQIKKNPAFFKRGIYRKETGTGGVAPRAQSFFECLENEFSGKCVWLDLQDFEDGYSVIHEFLRTIALRRGVFQLEHLTYLVPVADDDAALRSHLKRLCGRLAIYPGNWWLFLNERFGAGGCASWILDRRGSGSSRERGDELPLWTEAEKARLRRYISALLELGFNVLYMPMTEDRALTLARRRKIADEMVDRVREACKAWSESIGRASGMAVNFTPRKIAAASEGESSLFEHRFQNIEHYAVAYLKEVDHSPAGSHRNRLRFLFALTLFRQSRHTSALCMDALCRCGSRLVSNGQDNDASRLVIIKGWLNDLLEKKLLWRKPGGALWMFGDVRQNLHSFLTEIDIIESERYARSGESNRGSAGAEPLGLTAERSRMHFWIGDWYKLAFFATSNHMPLLEGLFHYFQSALFAPAAKPAGTVEADLALYRIQRFEMGVASMTKVLILARPWLKFWLQTLAPSNIFASPKLAEEVSTRLHEQIGALSRSAASRLEALVGAFEAEVAYLARLLGDARNGFVNSWQPSFRLVEKDGQGASNARPGLMLYPATTINSLALKKRWYETAAQFAEGQFDTDIVRALMKGVEANASVVGFEGFVKRYNNRFSTPGSLSETQILALSEFLGEFSYLLFRRTRILNRCNLSTLESRSWGEEQKRDPQIIEQHCVGIVAASLVSLTLCSRAHPWLQEAELLVRIKVHNLYGVVLAQLGRFCEAQRQFDLVLGQVSKMSLPDKTLGRLRTELRRAEALLLEARRLRVVVNRGGQAGNYEPQLTLHDPLKGRGVFTKRATGFDPGEIAALHSAKLDDVNACLENAHNMLSGRNYSALWWGYYINLQLESYAEMHPFENVRLSRSHSGENATPLILRRPLHHKEHIKSLLEQGILTAPGDGFNCLCVLESAIDAMRGYCKFTGEENNEKNVFRDIYRSCNPQMGKLRSPLLRKYRRVFENYFGKR